MAYPINTAIIVLLSSMIPIIATLALCLKKIIKEKRREILILFLMTLDYFSSTVFCIVLEITRNPIWKSVVLFHSIIFGFLIIFFVDVISKEHLGTNKIIVTAFIAGIFFIKLIDVNAFITGFDSNGDWYLLLSPTQTLSLVFLNGWSGLTMIVYLVYLAIKAPPNLRKYVYYFFAVTFGFVGYLVYLTLVPDTWVLPYFDYIIISVMVTLLTFLFTTQPKLFYVLPFKALRMTVLDTESGIFLYDFKWDKNSKMIDDVIYSGMMQGIRSIVKESMNKGDLNEMRTEGAIIILEYDKKANIACVLASTKSSQTLHDALGRFKLGFNKKFSQFFSQRSNTSLFKDSDSLIKEIFAFLPDTESEK